MSYVMLPEAEEKSARTLTAVIYVLYAALFISGGVTAIIAIVMNYVKKDDMVGTLYEGHFRWQIRTFWFSLPWFIIGGILSFVLVGFPILFVVSVWVIYRLIKGGLRLYENKPMYAEVTYAASPQTSSEPQGRTFDDFGV